MGSLDVIALRRLNSPDRAEEGDAKKAGIQDGWTMHRYIAYPSDQASGVLKISFIATRKH